MAYPTFTPISHPDQAVDRTRNPKTRVNSFGDGYEQVTSVGINSNLEEISPKWTNATKSEGEYIINFLDERKGRPFYYQMNGQGPVKCYRCETFTPRQKKGNYYDITAKFTETAMV